MNKSTKETVGGWALVSREVWVPWSISGFLLVCTTFSGKEVFEKKIPKERLTCGHQKPATRWTQKKTNPQVRISTPEMKSKEKNGFRARRNEGGKWQQWRR